MSAATSAPVLSVRDIRKSFRETPAVDGVSFDVRRGTITGLLGRNGAGKTTTLRMINRIFLPDSGEVVLFDSNDAEAARDRVGYLPEERGLYKKMKILEQLLFFAEIKQRRPAEAKARAQEWLARFGLSDAAGRRLEELSKGNQQKVQIIAALIHDPELIILDEPMSGLDPVNVVLVREVLRQLCADGKTILLSTHMMGEAERMVDDIVLIHRGRVVLSGPLSEVRRSHGTDTVHLGFEGDGAFLAGLPGVARASVQNRAAELRLSAGADTQVLLSACAGRLRLHRFEVAEPSLEEIFIDRVGDVPAAVAEAGVVRRAWAVFKREYLQEVRKKSFLILTVLMPFLFIGMMLVPALVLSRSVGEKRIAVVDGTGRLKAAFDEGAPATESSRAPFGPSGGTAGRRAEAALALSTEYHDASGRVEEESKAQRSRLREKGAGLDGVLVIPPEVFEDPTARVILYGRGGADFVTQERLGRLVNRAVTRQRLLERGIEAAEVEKLLTRLRVEGAQVSRSGEVKTGGEAGFLVAFVFGALLILPMLIYGQEILRGIVAEKADRVVEILISSMTPFQLLAGKIVGVAAVGLTQVSVWLAMAAAAGAFAATAAASAGFSPFAALDPAIFPMFVVFFLLGYLTYASIYAIGGAVSNSDKEAQQFVAPILLFMLLPWFLAMPILQSPDGRLATILSLAPFFSPMAMFLRIVSSEPPLWQILLSILVSAATVAGLLWLTAKIFRVGILSYGKRPTIPELWRWMKAA